MMMRRALVLIFALCSTASAQIPEQYPKPLIHTPTDHPATRILLVTVDGLRAFDLANFVAAHPQSTLAALSARGVTYTNAHTPWPDPAAGLLALTTGGTPISTSILSSDGYDRSLSPSESACKTRGAPVALTPLIVADDAPLDPAHDCSPVLPHQLLHVNTIFDVVHQKIGPTAWVGDRYASTDLLRGSNGQGLDEPCAFATDAARLDAVIHLIDNGSCFGRITKPTPILFGLAYTGIATAQTGAPDSTLSGTPFAKLSEALQSLDSTLSRIVVELKSKNLYDSTWIVVAGTCGTASPQTQHHISAADLAAAIKPAIAAHISAGNLGLIWLADPSTTSQAVKALEAKSAALGIHDIYSGERLALTLNLPAQDPRMPDIIVDFGGLSDRATHVALLVSGAQLTGRADPTLVPTTQLGPLLLRALGMEKFDLDALHREHSPALPGIF
jgi:hypothetical protein